MEIREILSKYDTDKEWHHHYGNVYNHIFSQFNRQAPLNILEIGTQKGGSLLAWKEYFPNANVTGVDIVDVVPKKYRKDTVTRIISDIKDYKTNQNFDIVIDDGSHYLPDVVYVITQYCNKLNKGGVLIIEDVRFPNLLGAVIKNIFDDMRIVIPNYNPDFIFDVRSYDNRNIGETTSYIITITKLWKT